MYYPGLDIRVTDGVTVGGLYSDTFGAMYIGAMIAMGVYGITTLQTYFYFLHYPHDSLRFKTLVFFVWVLDTIHCILMCHAMYKYLVTGYGRPQMLETGTWSLFASIAFNIVIAFISQCFFTKRIHDLGHKRFRWILSSIIAIIVLAHFAFGIETVVQFSLKKQFARLNEVDAICVIPFGITAILSDIVIAATLVILLRQSRSEFEDTNSLIKKLIVYAINRCILTSVVAILEVILFLSFPGSLYPFAFDFVIGKLYANSLLASLNSRRSLNRRVEKGRGRSSTRFSTVFNVATVEDDSQDASESMSMGRSFGTNSHLQSTDQDQLNSQSSRTKSTVANAHRRRRSMPVMNV